MSIRFDRSKLTKGLSNRIKKIDSRALSRKLFVMSGLMRHRYNWHKSKIYDNSFWLRKAKMNDGGG